jgi:hypothetical protein
MLSCGPRFDDECSNLGWPLSTATEEETTIMGQYHEIFNLFFSSNIFPWATFSHTKLFSIQFQIRQNIQNLKLTRRCQWYSWVKKKFPPANPNFLSFVSKALGISLYIEIGLLFSGKEMRAFKDSKFDSEMLSLIQRYQWYRWVNFKFEYLGDFEFWVGGVTDNVES